MSEKMNSQEMYEALKKEYDQFLYIVSHDIKAPLRAITNLTEWLEDDIQQGNQDEIVENLQLLRERVKRLEDMMNALLELSRVAKTDLELTEICLKDTIESLIQVEEVADSVEFLINVSVEKNCFQTYGKKLKKVLRAVIENALKFNDKDLKRIEVNVVEENAFYVITIRDNGPGVSETAQNKIFDIFYTATAKDSSYSVGAGLAISKRICQFVGGEIKFKNITGGSEFHIKWPKKVNEIN